MVVVELAVYSGGSAESVFKVSYVQWQHEVKLLSLVAFCKKRCHIILCGAKMPSFSCVYTRYQLMYQDPSRGQLKLNKQYNQIS